MTTTQTMATTRTTTEAAAAQQSQAPSPAQLTWSSGDYRRIANLVVGLADRLVEAADLRHGERVLDVATGNGNLALAAARRGAAITGIDIAPPLLEHAQQRASLDGLEVTFRWGDAQALAFADDAFDVTLSVIGVMFAPDQQKAADELLRVTRPGGRVGVLSWTPDGFIGDLFRAMGAHVPPPAGSVPPVRWGSVQGLAELFGERVQWTSVTHGDWRLTFSSAKAYAEYYAQNYGPTVRALQGLDAPAQAAVVDAIAETVAARNIAADGTVAWDARYLQAVGTVR